MDGKKNNTKEFFLGDLLKGFGDYYKNEERVNNNKITEQFKAKKEEMLTTAKTEEEKEKINRYYSEEFVSEIIQQVSGGKQLLFKEMLMFCYNVLEERTVSGDEVKVSDVLGFFISLLDEFKKIIYYMPLSELDLTENEEGKTNWIENEKTLEELSETIDKFENTLNGLSVGDGVNPVKIYKIKGTHARDINTVKTTDGAIFNMLEIYKKYGELNKKPGDSLTNNDKLMILKCGKIK